MKIIAIGRDIYRIKNDLWQRLEDEANKDDANPTDESGHVINNWNTSFDKLIDEIRQTHKPILYIDEVYLPEEIC